MSKVILNSTNEAYHADREFISSSGLKSLLRDPGKFHHEYILGHKEETEKDAFTEGSFVHTLILEPEKVQEYAIFDGLRKAGKTWEAFKEANKDKTILSAPQVARCEKLYKAYAALPKAVELCSGGFAEHSMVSKILDLKVKARADYIVPGEYIIDVKTTSMPSDVEIFKQTVQEYGYDLSAAFYNAIAFDTYKALHDFYWLVLSKADGQCHIYKASETTLALGRAKYMKALTLYKQCLTSGKWQHEHEVEQNRLDYEILSV